MNQERGLKMIQTRWNKKDEKSSDLNEINVSDMLEAKILPTDSSPVDGLDDIYADKSSIPGEDLLESKKQHTYTNIKFVLLGGLVLIVFAGGYVSGLFLAKDSPFAQSHVSQIPSDIQDIYKLKDRACGGQALKDKFGKALCSLVKAQVEKSIQIVDPTVSNLLGQEMYLSRENTTIAPEIRVTELKLDETIPKEEVKTPTETSSTPTKIDLASIPKM